MQNESSQQYGRIWKVVGLKSKFQTLRNMWIELNYVYKIYETLVILSQYKHLLEVVKILIIKDQVMKYYKATKENKRKYKMMNRKFNIIDKEIILRDNFVFYKNQSLNFYSLSIYDILNIIEKIIKNIQYADSERTKKEQLSKVPVTISFIHSLQQTLLLLGRLISLNFIKIFMKILKRNSEVGMIQNSYKKGFWCVSFALKLEIQLIKEKEKQYKQGRKAQSFYLNKYSKKVE
ncbi:unnamed protein product [Paramecium primaurelia]|uniref:Uncharacterized protein n=1 Tax=Paramecium primaurelia TaxID=5886 RepID=A0A8S1NTH4_PARPR|nr:unnamed protein product [Paramecium primaurelia]